MKLDKKKMRKHKKFTPKSKKITAEVASLMLGTGLLMGVNSRPVKASRSNEDEIEIVRTAEAKYLENGMDECIDQESSDTAIEVTAEKSEKEERLPTYQDAVDKVEEINKDNDQKLQDAIKDAEDQGIKVNITDKIEDISTTVGGIEENKEKLDQYTAEQIKKIQDFLDKNKYNQGTSAIDILKKYGLLGKDEEISSKKIEQLLHLGIENFDYKAEVEILNSEKVHKEDALEEEHRSIWDDYEILGDIEGDFLKVTYSNLENSSYDQTKIDKIEIVYSNFIADNKSSTFLVNIGHNMPYFFALGKSVTMSMEFYDQQGKIITLDENTAFISSEQKIPGAGKIEVLNGDDYKGTAGGFEGWNGWNNWTDILNVSGNSINIRFYCNTNSSLWGEINTIDIPEELNHIGDLQIFITPGQLVLNKNSNVYIHYIDVNGEAQSGVTDFSPTNGTEITDHKQNITHLAVGDKYQNVLWDWEKAGYTLAIDNTDQNAIEGIIGKDDAHYYVYLKHQAPTEIKREQKVELTFQYKPIVEEGSLSKDQTITVTYIRTGLQSSVNPNEIDWKNNWSLSAEDQELLKKLENVKIPFYTKSEASSDGFQMKDDLYQESGNPIKTNIVIRYENNLTSNIHREQLVDFLVKYITEDGHLLTEQHFEVPYLQVGFTDGVTTEWDTYWRLDENYKNAFDDYEHPTIDWYTPVRNSIIFDFQMTNDKYQENKTIFEEVKVMCEANRVNDINCQQSVDLIVHYKTDDGSSISDQKITLIFTQAGLQDSVNPNLIKWTGKWILTNPEVFDQLTPPELWGYTANKEVTVSDVKMSDVEFEKYGKHRTEEVTVTCSREAMSNTSWTEQSSSNSEILNSNLITNNETNSTTPLSEKNAENSQEKVDEEIEPQEEAVRKNKSKLFSINHEIMGEKAAVENLSADKTDEKVGSVVKGDQEILPETGEVKDEFVKKLSSIMTMLGIVGLFATSRKRNKKQDK